VDQISTATSIITAMKRRPRYRRPDPVELNLLDRLLWRPLPFDSIRDYQETLPPDTQLSLFHPCAHCGVGQSADVESFCNHCQRYLTRRMLPRGWWASGRGFKLGIVLWSLNCEMKEARRRALEYVTHLLATTLIGVVGVAADNTEFYRTISRP